MCEMDKTRLQSLAEALEVLPDHKKDVLLAYGEGMAAMAKKQADEVAGGEVMG